MQTREPLLGREAQTEPKRPLVRGCGKLQASKIAGFYNIRREIFPISSRTTKPIDEIFSGWHLGAPRICMDNFFSSFVNFCRLFRRNLFKYPWET